MDPSWPVIYEADAYTGYEALPGVAVYRARAGHDEVEDDARALVQACAAWLRSQAQPGRVLIVVDGMNSQSLGARRYYARYGDSVGADRLALVGQDGFAWAMLTFFFSLYRPEGLKMRLFEHFDGAMEWLVEGLDADPAR